MFVLCKHALYLCVQGGRKMIRFLKVLVIVFLSVVVLNQYNNESKVFVPVAVPEFKETLQDNPITKKLNAVGVQSSEKLVSAISFASEQNRVSPDLIIALTKTESTFNPKVCSKLGYCGLMQIPHKVFYSDANILIGTRILREKIEEADGDMTKALLLYKGYPLDSQRGHQQVRKVFSLYYKLKAIT